MAQIRGHKKYSRRAATKKQQEWYPIAVVTDTDSEECMKVVLVAYDPNAAVYRPLQCDAQGRLVIAP